MLWLDTETKGLLQKETPFPPTAVGTSEFGLVLLSPGEQAEWIARAICRINKCPSHEAASLLQHPLPIVVNDGLSHEAALAGQFELVSCDAISAFLLSEVLAGAGQDYLDTVFGKVMRSSEFGLVGVSISNIPNSDSGHAFLDQFFGPTAVDDIQQTSLLRRRVALKKARIMKYWADEIGLNFRIHKGHSE